jgi:exopolysaccharide production protein ExoQ
VALATDSRFVTTAASATLRLPVADLIVVAGIIIFGTNVLEVTLRGGPMEQFIGYTYMGFYIAFFTLAILSGAVPKALLRSPLLMVLLCLPLLSMLWSVDPGMTRFRTLLLIGTSAFGLFIGWYYDGKRLVRLLAIGVSVNMVLSAVFIVAIPSFGIDQTAAWAGTWKGAFNHKNGLGAAAGLGLLILFYAIATTNGLLRLAFLAAFALTAVLVVGSKSTTSLVVAIIGLALAFGFQCWRRTPGLTFAILFAVLIFLPILFLLISQHDLATLFLDSVDKDITVHGRTDIWQLVWPYIMDRFWLGYGFGSFWQPGFPWYSQMQARLHYTPFYSHNGIVEIWIAGGALTVGLTIAVYLSTLIKSAILALRPVSRPEAAFAFVFLICFAFRNITESSLLQPNDMLWLLFVALVVSTAKAVLFNLKQSDTVAQTDG